VVAQSLGIDFVILVADNYYCPVPALLADFEKEQVVKFYFGLYIVDVRLTAVDMKLVADNDFVAQHFVGQVDKTVVDVADKVAAVFGDMDIFDQNLVLHRMDFVNFDKAVDSYYKNLDRSSEKAVYFFS
jgi:hypothetical protein